ncbi:DUF5954 family protein [Streptomyces sp. T-3]|nr:DUF5954 family protein [Streptomyces sp. T-3]
MVIEHTRRQPLPAPRNYIPPPAPPTACTHPMPQQARDGLNSLLWFQAKDDTDDPAGSGVNSSPRWRSWSVSRSTN